MHKLTQIGILQQLGVRDFTRKNTPEFYDSKVKKDSQEFIDGVQNITPIMGDNSMESAYSAAY